MRNDEARVRSNREIAEGGEVTERKLGSSLFVQGRASRSEVTEENLGFRLFLLRPASRSEITEGNLGVPPSLPHRAEA